MTDNVAGGNKSILVTCGPIPAKLDSVKFVTNRFKGGLAFKTAMALAERSHDVTVMCWDGTTVPDNVRSSLAVEQVEDVVDYCRKIAEHVENHDFDAYVLAGAVANLMPSNPWAGKFPSHNYSVGEKFAIEFEIAPRAIDLVKGIDPRVTLIGYKLFDGAEDELIEAARLTQAESRADVIFANHPKTARSTKIAVTPDGAAIHMSFDEHIDMMDKAIRARHYRTVVSDVEETPAMAAAKNVVSLYEMTFERYGTVAVPVGVPGYPHAFATTARGHSGDPVVVLDVDHENLIVYATGKATLNAPALAAALPDDSEHAVVHRHEDDPRFEMPAESCDEYLFPGTAEESSTVGEMFRNGAESVMIPHHGNISVRRISKTDWDRYEELYPVRYMGDKPEVADAIAKAVDEMGCAIEEAETLEVGGGKRVTAKYSYDAYVEADNAEMLSWEDIAAKPDGFFDLVLMRNSIAYLSEEQISTLMRKAKRFIANSFAEPRENMVRGAECAHVVDGMVEHRLLLGDDSLMAHSFHAYGIESYEALGLKTTSYGKNSVLIEKG